MAKHQSCYKGTESDHSTSATLKHNLEMSFILHAGS